MEYQLNTEDLSDTDFSVLPQNKEPERPEFPKLVLSDSSLGKHIDNTEVLTKEEQMAQRRETFLGKTYNPLDSGHIDIKLSLVQNTEGVDLIAKGHLYWVYGEPGTRKTWLGLKVLEQAKTLYIDLEAEPWTIGKRLKDMQMPYDKGALFYTPADPQDFKSSIQAITELDVDVVVIDSASGMFNLMGCDTNNDQHVAEVFGKILKPIRSSGKTVFVVDHIAKNAGNKDFPFGSQNKKAQSDVCMYLKLNEHTDETEIFITKDRLGLYEDLISKPDKQLAVMRVEGTPTAVNIYPHDSFEIFEDDIRRLEETAKQIVLDGIRRNPGMLLGEVSNIRGVASSRKVPARDQLIAEGLVIAKEVPRENSGGLQIRLYAHDYVEQE